MINPAAISPRDLGKISPEKLSTAASLPEDQKIDELSRQFEAVLVRKILSEAQKPLLGPGLASGNSVNGIYQDMMVSQLADNLVHSHSFGIARALSQQLSRQTGEPAPATEPLNP